MYHLVDYLSFTVPFTPIDRRFNHALASFAEAAIDKFLEGQFGAIVDGQEFTVGAGRRPYSFSWGRADGGVRIFAACSIPNVLVEITGTGCQTLRQHQALENILAMVQERVTRLDLAVDITTDTMPADFVEKRDVQRFKSLGHRDSDTGSTWYVGSEKSDRWARVYRYYWPHPRHAQLRVEHVFRRKAAKAATKGILESGYANVVNACGDVFGWTHEEWDASETVGTPLKTVPVSRASKNTVRWLYGAVTQAIVRVVRHGELDYDEWNEHVSRQLRKFAAGFPDSGISSNGGEVPPL